MRHRAAKLTLGKFQPEAASSVQVPC